MLGNMFAWLSEITANWQAFAYFLVGVESFWKITLDLFVGFGETLKIFGVTLLFSLPLGLVIAFGSMCPFKPVAAISKFFVWVIRGTPLMLQLIVVYYGPGLVFGRPFFTVAAATYLTFSINYACYFSEIYRGGFGSITRGQYEAAQVLGMTRWETFRHVILMQVVKRLLPPMSNEVITLVKDTSLARTIMVAEIFFINETEIITKGIVWPLFYIGVFFLLFVGALTLLFNYLEKKLSYYKV